MEKARDLAVDAIIFDLEDAVAPAEKIAARDLLARALLADYGSRARIVRRHSEWDVEAGIFTTSQWWAAVREPVCSITARPVPRSEASMPKTFMRPNRTPVPADEKAPNSLRIPELFPGGATAG